MLDSVFTLIRFVALSGIWITSDHLQNAYLITSRNDFVKMDSSGTFLSQYNQNKFGTLTFADVSNPMKMVLSYPDYGTVVMLDNTLSELAVLELRKSGILSMSAGCSSLKDNNLWVFDNQEYKLKKIDRNGNTILASSDMFQLLGVPINPVSMLEYNGFVYLNDPEAGIFVFDVYGIHKETLPFRGFNRFHIRNNQLFLFSKGDLLSFDLATLSEKRIALPKLPVAGDATIEKNRLYVLSADSVGIYSY